MTRARFFSHCEGLEPLMFYFCLRFLRFCLVLLSCSHLWHAMPQVLFGDGVRGEKAEGTLTPREVDGQILELGFDGL